MRIETRRTRLVLLSAPLLLLGVVPMASAAAAAPTAPTQTKALAAAKPLKPTIHNAVRHDRSPKLSAMPALKAAPVARTRQKNPPLGRLPHTITAPGARAAGSNVTAHTSDVQGPAAVSNPTMPAIGQNFEGVSNLNGVFPPDTNMAVGPQDILETVNFSFAVYDKQGNTLLGPETISTVFQGFGGACDPTTANSDSGDPVTMYDEAANRWFISQFAFGATGSDYNECIAVSQTGDPTGAYNRYDFDFGSTLNDYPKFGVWPDAYYMSNNDFANGGATFTGVTVTAFNRSQMLAGQQAQDVQFTTGTQYGSLLPSNTEGGALGIAPPVGAPNPFFMSCDPNAGGPCTSNQLDEWDFHVDWTNPANSTFGNSGDPSMTLPVAAFNSNLCNFDDACVPQPGTPARLDPLSDRLMYQSAYRVLDDGTQAVVLNQTVNVGTSGGNQAGVRWYELTNTGSGWTVADQGTYAPDTDNRWMGSANIDASGDIAVGYSVSSSTTFPSIRVAGRLAGDPAGQLTQGEETVIAGTGSQTGVDQFGRGRWGDYSAMQVDPTNSCTFWYTTEYMQTTSLDNWQTRVASFKFPSCIQGPHGTVTGTVTDATTGKAISGAAVSIGQVSTMTDSSGNYTVAPLAVGSYTESISAFGYASDTISNVAVTDNGTTTENAALISEPSVTVRGKVTDGSGQGWGLHASLVISGMPGGPVWTDPATGAYSVQLPENATYALKVTTDLPGYQTVSDSVTVGTSALTHNISVPVNAETCTAPGYSFSFTPVLSENFDDYAGSGGTAPPPGWTIQDNLGNNQVWTFNNPDNVGNRTGGSGNFAVVESDAYGSRGQQDTSLITPVFSLAGTTTPVLKFNNDYFGIAQEAGAVDISTDGGQSWTNVWQHTSDSVRGPDTEIVPLAQYAGDTSVQARFHFVGKFSWWWEIDNVMAGNRPCIPQPGGLVVGQTTDANTGNGLNDVTVTETDASPAVHVTSGPTGDWAIGTGYYWLFSPETGTHPFTAVHRGGYVTANASVGIDQGTSTSVDFTLDAGQLSVTPSPISRAQVLGTTTNTTMTLKNTGTAPVNVKLEQRGGAFQILAAQGAKLHQIPAGGVDGGDPTTPAFLGGRVNDGTPVANAGNDPAWTAIADYPTAVMDNSADFIDGKEYSVGGLDTTFRPLSSGNVYDPMTNTWSAIAGMPKALTKPGVVADNGKLYVEGGWDFLGQVSSATYVYDPSRDSWSTIADNPAPTTAPGVADLNGVIYFVAGCDSTSCDQTSNVETYNTSTGTWASVAAYPHPDSWLSCGGINGKVYCSGGVNSTSTFADGYVYDPGTDTWSPIASMPIDLWASVSGAADGLLIVSGGVTNGSATITNQGFAYDPTTNTWSSIPNSQFTVLRAGGSCGFYKIGGSSSGGSPQSASEMLSGLTGCGLATIPWMTESPTTAILQPGQSVKVAVTLSATTADQVTQPGTYAAEISFEQDTPYQVNPVNVTMKVTPPDGWGKIAGTLSGENCQQVTAPLRGVVLAGGRPGTGFDLTVATATDGSYAFWGPAADNPYALTGSADGWSPVTVKPAIVNAGKTTTVNITLHPAAPC